jgi:hypothetical protein
MAQLQPGQPANHGRQQTQQQQQQPNGLLIHA